MAARKSRKKAHKKTRRPVRVQRKKPARRKKRVSTATKKAIAINKQAQWAAYRELQRQIYRTWNKLKADVERRADPNQIIRDQNQLLLLLGECDYMIRECGKLNPHKHS
jgi:hypothetical protein